MVDQARIAQLEAVSPQDAGAAEISSFAGAADPAAFASRWQAALEVALIFALFFIQAAWPVPEVNEPHYLGKARHYWEPAWCNRDFFLSTADAHQVFYWSIGWLTRFMPLAAVAWCGRLASWLLLAWAWRRLSRAIVPYPFTAVLSAGLLAAATFRCHMSGEWLLGGFEAKTIAYAFVFLAMAELAHNRYARVWPLLGVASAWHVLVGGWSVVAAGGAWLVQRADRPPLRTMVPSLGIGLLLALPGLAPALLLTIGADPTTLREANRIYVFERLPHHLVPQTFPTNFVVRHVLLIGLWLALCAVTRPSAADRRIRSFVAVMILIAGAGVVVAFATAHNDALTAGLLRYYWFRMTDILVPAGVALAATQYIVGLLIASDASPRRRPAPLWASCWLIVALSAVGLHLGEIVLRRQADPRAPAENNLASPAAWREICRWVSENTDPDALFLTPRLAHTFRWHTGRAEVVTRKDIPQDAAGIVAWWQRMRDVHFRHIDEINQGWWRSFAEQGSVRVKELGERYGADYVITDAMPPLALELVSPPNEFYAVYRLPKSPAADAASDSAEAARQTPAPER